MDPNTWWALMCAPPSPSRLTAAFASRAPVRRAQPVPLSGWPAPFGALAGRMPSIEIEDIKAARREALRHRLP
jgi:hypothetical protein